MQEDQFWLLVSLKLSGEATAEELDTLDALLKEHPEMGLRLDILNDLWAQQHPAPPGRQKDALNRHLQRLSHHLSEPVLKYETAGPGEPAPAPNPVPPGRSAGIAAPEENTGAVLYRRRLFRIVTGIAASVAALFLLLSQGGTKRTPSQTAQNTVSTKPGSKAKIQLPDGSQVWLNADSRLTYNESFRGAAREVLLTGEAYFDVAKDKNHPFIIHTSSIDVRVLGTSLNVRSYSNEKNTEAVLIHGSVEVTLLNSPDKKIILQPNEKLVVQNGNATVSGRVAPAEQKEAVLHPVMTLGRAHFKEKDSIATEVLWVKNKLAFDQETLESVALKIERWYDVKVTITDETLKGTEYSGVFDEENLRQVMEALRLTGNFRYTINKKEVTIRP
jgi:transmembrane sensor